jgi:hypothetical protein
MDCLPIVFSIFLSSVQTEFDISLLFLLLALVNLWAHVETLAYSAVSVYRCGLTVQSCGPQPSMHASQINMLRDWNAARNIHWNACATCYSYNSLFAFCSCLVCLRAVVTSSGQHLCAHAWQNCTACAIFCLKPCASCEPSQASNQQANNIVAQVFFKCVRPKTSPSLTLHFLQCDLNLCSQNQRLTKRYQGKHTVIIVLSEEHTQFVIEGVDKGENQAM